MTRTAPRPIPFVTRVRIENYKSIARCDVALGPFNVLLGLNTAGKSNFLDALRFLRDVVTRSLGKAVVMRGGLDDVLHRVPEPTGHASIAAPTVLDDQANRGSTGPSATLAEPHTHLTNGCRVTVFRVDSDPRQAHYKIIMALHPTTEH